MQLILHHDTYFPGKCNAYTMSCGEILGFFGKQIYAIIDQHTTINSSVWLIYLRIYRYNNDSTSAIKSFQAFYSSNNLKEMHSRS